MIVLPGEQAEVSPAELRLQQWILHPPGNLLRSATDAAFRDADGASGTRRRRPLGAAELSAKLREEGCEVVVCENAALGVARSGRRHQTGL